MAGELHIEESEVARVVVVVVAGAETPGAAGLDGAGMLRNTEETAAVDAAAADTAAGTDFNPTLRQARVHPIFSR